MDTNINGNVIQKSLETVANVTKMAANLSESKKNDQKRENRSEYRGGNTTQQPHTQTVEVKVGGDTGNQKPQVIEKRPETHIHKHFPDNRALTEDECKLEKFRIEMEYAEKDKERQHIILMADKSFQQQLEKERKDRAEREKDRAKKRKYWWFAGGLAAVATIGLICLDNYTSNRGTKSLGSGSGPVLEAEGTVE